MASLFGRFCVLNLILLSDGDTSPLFSRQNCRLERMSGLPPPCIGVLDESSLASEKSWAPGCTHAVRP
ncbi:hypothetical protein ACTXT7_001857 [Hymenolepis weldensis]